MSFIATIIWLVEQAIPTLPTYLQDQTRAAIKEHVWSLDCPEDTVRFTSNGKVIWTMAVAEFDPQGLAYRARGS